MADKDYLERKVDESEEVVKEKLEKVKEYIKKIDWDKVSTNWTVKYRRCMNCKTEQIQLNPYSDCSKENPLYLHKEWLQQIYNDEELNLSDRKIAKMYGLNHKTIGSWRKKYNIPTKEEKARYTDDKGYIRLYMPRDYQHPELKPTPSGRMKRKEHDVIMENHLAQHPEWKISQDCLIDGKYLKSECEVHHINHINDDNRLENLWLYRNKSDHSYAQRSFNDSFSGLIKLEQIKFDNGKYYLNEGFDYRNMNTNEIKELIKPTEFKGEMTIEEIKEKIKKIDWNEISNDWTVWKASNQFGEVRMLVDPYKDCSRDNPLYRHKGWVETIVKKKEFNLTDPHLAEVCGISERSAYRWRWEKHRIPTYDERWGKMRLLHKRKRGGDQIITKIPDDYDNPFATKRIRHNEMLEHRYIMERHLAEHPDWDISKKALLNDKYLKPEYYVHHINFDPLDNRLENLWVVKGPTGHSEIENSLNNLVDQLLKSDLLHFKNGKYSINYDKENFEENF